MLLDRPIEAKRVQRKVDRNRKRVSVDDQAAADDGGKMKHVAKGRLLEAAQVDATGKEVPRIPVHEDDAATVVLDHSFGDFTPLVGSGQPLVAMLSDREVVDDPERIALLEEAPRQVAADEAAAAGDQSRFGLVEHHASQFRAARAAMVFDRNSSSLSAIASCE